MPDEPQTTTPPEPAPIAQPPAQQTTLNTPAPTTPAPAPATPAPEPTATTPAPTTPAPTTPAPTTPAPKPATQTTPQPAATTPAPEPTATPPADDKPWFTGLPDNWREQVAGEDTKKLSELQRFQTPDKWIESYFEAQNLIARRQENMIPKLGEKPSDAEVAAYRQATGVPESPDKYDMGDDFQLGDEDKAELKPVFERLHAANVPNEVAKAVATEWLSTETRRQEAAERQDALDQAHGMASLKETWKGDYDGNIQRVSNLMSKTFPKETLEALMGARLADGTAIFNNPAVMVGFTQLAREINPAEDLVPAGQVNQMGSLEDQKKELEAKMGTDEWYKDTASQQKYIQILEAMNTIQGRQQQAA